MTNRKPAEAPKVPWGVVQNGETPTPPIDFVNPESPTSPDLAKLQASLSGQPVKQSSPFAPKPVEKKVEEKPTFEMGDAPSWGRLVAFVQKHGNVIIQARHPQPRGGCIDTIYRGVTVFAHETCQLRHKDLGWVTWQDAQYE